MFEKVWVLKIIAIGFKEDFKWYGNIVSSAAGQFFEKFYQDHEDYRQADLARLGAVKRREHMENNAMLQEFK